jgi:aspartate/methionine/tyrosine aminotransferase
MANVTATGMDSKELADFLLYEAGVSCLDGGCFGDYGKGFIRFSYANSMANLMEAVERIKKVSPRWTSRS